MKSILDPTFRYTPAASTDLRKTFARVRREMAREAQQESRYHSLPVGKSKERRRA